MGDGEYDAEEGHEVLGVAISPAVPGDVDVEPSTLPLPHLVTVSAAGVEFSVIKSDNHSFTSQYTFAQCSLSSTPIEIVMGASGKNEEWVYDSDSAKDLDLEESLELENLHMYVEDSY